MQLGIVGLGKMGGNMATRLRRHDVEVVGYDRAPGSRDVDSLERLVAGLERPRSVWVMVPAGEPTDSTVSALADLLDEDDLVVDGGNSRWTDSLRHRDLLAERGVRFVDAGVSGGVHGLDDGYCIMAGGDDDDVTRLRPVFEALVTEGGFAHVGPPGAGHFTKMVHNGVEYGMMQALAEGYELLGAGDVPVDVPAALEVWRHGSVVRSWLLDLFAPAVAENPGLRGIEGWAADSGEGRWTVEAAIDHAVPTPVIAAALFARFSSRQEDSPAMQAIAVMRNQFGGHAVKEEGR